MDTAPEFAEPDFFWSPIIFIPTTITFLAGLVCFGLVFLSNAFVRKTCRINGFSPDCWVGIFIIGLCLLSISIVYSNLMVTARKKKLIRQIREEIRLELEARKKREAETAIAPLDIINTVGMAVGDSKHPPIKSKRHPQTSVYMERMSNKSVRGRDIVLEQQLERGYIPPTVESLEVHNEMEENLNTYKKKSAKPKMSKKFHPSMLKTREKSQSKRTLGVNLSESKEQLAIDAGFLPDPKLLGDKKPPLDKPEKQEELNSSFEDGPDNERHRRSNATGLLCPSLLRSYLININR